MSSQTTLSLARNTKTEFVHSSADHVKVRRCDRTLLRVSLMIRYKDTLKIHGVHICPSEIERIIREHPEVVDCVVAGVRGACQSDGIVPRAWLVLSESAKAKGADCMLGAIEEFLRGRLSDQHWLHGGFEVIDEVLLRFAHLHYPWRTTDKLP